MGIFGGGLSKTIFKNSSLNAAKTVVLSLLTFITTPIILHKLGTEQYGIWALVIAFASYANFLELGFNNAVTRLVASDKSQFSVFSSQFSDTSSSVVSPSVLETEKLKTDKPKSDNREPRTENRDVSVPFQINSTVITYILVSAVVFTVAFIFLHPIENLLFHNIFVAHLDLMLLGTLFCFLMNLTTSNYLSVLSGKLRMDLTNVIAISTNLTQAVLSVSLLYAGYGLMGVFLASVVSSVLGSLLSVIFAKRVYPSLFLSLRQYNFARIKDLFKFSLKIYFINSSGNFLQSTNKFLISALAGLQFVTYYEIGWKVVNQVRVFFQNILEPVYPASSMLTTVEGEEGRIRRRNAFNKAFKYLLIMSTLAYCVLFILSYPVFLLWLGKNFVHISLIVLIIGFGNYVNLQTAIGFYFLSSLNRLQSAMMSAILTIACNFAFSLILFYAFGFYGMLIGFALGQIMPSLWFIWVSKKEALQND
jgi:O-antigen/teichoic acid export membrane protein